jgi:hypothetical protein
MAMIILSASQQRSNDINDINDFTLMIRIFLTHFKFLTQLFLRQILKIEINNITLNK